jgi:type VI protein secretion system component VasF
MRRDDIDEDLFPLGPPDRRVRAPRPPAGRLDLVVTWALFCSTVPLLAVGWFGVVLAMFAFDACGGGGCNSTAGSAAYLGFPIAAALSTVLHAFATARRRRDRRRTWMVGAAAVLTIVALFVVAATVIQVATHPA